MRSKLTLPKAFTAIIVLAMLVCILPRVVSDNGYSYQLVDHLGGSTYYGLNVAVSQSLYDYYFEKSHRANSNNDFAEFVTPYALHPISDCLGQIYEDDEDFANGALMIVHQIPYEASAQPKYPVETIVGNKGDCDLFSYIAASIVKAHGMDVVLLYYESDAHMNVGVSLSHAPSNARQQAHYVTYSNVRYYIAECTGGNWQDGWRVGECPDSLQTAPVQVIALEDSEQSAPGQVSASYQTLASSAMSVAVGPTFLFQGATATLSGQLSPALANKTVTVYIKINSLPWAVLDTFATDSNGRFTYAWNIEDSGICYVRASWSGDGDYSGADSRIETVTVLSVFFIMLLGITVILACLGIVVLIVSRRTRQETLEPEPPEIPS
jgi:hypothetical protein